MSDLKTIGPEHAAALIRAGAILIDVREAPEHAAESIPGARHHALSTIDPRQPIEPGDAVLIFHCKSGGRTSHHARRLAAFAGECEAYVLGGGIDGWRRSGLPTSAARADEMRRAGGLIGRISSLLR